MNQKIIFEGILKGNDFVEINSGKVIFHRLGEKVILSEAELIRQCTRATPNVRIKFTTDSKTIRLLFTMNPQGYNDGNFPDSDILVYQNNIFDQSYTFSGKGKMTLDITPRQSGFITYEVVLPPWHSPILTDIKLDKNSQLVESKADDRPVYIAFGDSITQGMNQQSSNEVYPSFVARHFNWNLVNLGVGASLVNSEYGNLLENQKVSAITILWGINNWFYGNDYAGFIKEYKQLLDNIRKHHPGVPIFCINLIANKLGKVPEEAIYPDRISSMDDFRKGLAELVDSRIKTGDSALFLIDGLSISSQELIEDEVHFSIEGAGVFGTQLAKKIDEILKTNKTVNVTKTEGTKPVDEKKSVEAQEKNKRITEFGFNLAYGKKVVISSKEGDGFEGSMAVDGNLKSRWASLEGKDPQWITIDLEKKLDLSKVVLRWEDAFAKVYKVEASDNKVSWRLLLSETGGNGGIDELDIKGNGRYLRIYCSKRGTDFGYSLYELEAYSASYQPSEDELKNITSSDNVATANSNNKEKLELNKVLFTGRFDFSDSSGPVFAWSGSSIKANFKGTGLKGYFKPMNPHEKDNWFEIIVDAKSRGKIQIDSAKEYTLVAGLKNANHTIEIFKRTEAFVGEVQFQGFTVEDGELLDKPELKKRKIEFIGDSITCGYGNEAKNKESPFKASEENGYLSYNSIAAGLLDAEQAVIAWSGKGVYRDYGAGRSTPQMPELYRKTLPSLSDSSWDFSRWIPDVVVINLGTNDFAQGILSMDDFNGEFRKLIQFIRKNYSQAVIYCCIGPLLYEEGLITCRDYLGQLVKEFNNTGDSRIYLIEFPEQQEEDGYGADWHPSKKTHRKMAEQLVKTIQKDLGW